MGNPIIPLDLTLVSLKGQNRVIHILKELVKGLRYVTLVIIIHTNNYLSQQVLCWGLGAVHTRYLHTWGEGGVQQSFLVFIGVLPTAGLKHFIGIYSLIPTTITHMTFFSLITIMRLQFIYLSCLYSAIQTDKYPLLTSIQTVIDHIMINIVSLPFHFVGLTTSVLPTLWHF